jgi:hypothetical protein
VNSLGTSGEFGCIFFIPCLRAIMSIGSEDAGVIFESLSARGERKFAIASGSKVNSTFNWKLWFFSLSWCWFVPNSYNGLPRSSALNRSDTTTANLSDGLSPIFSTKAIDSEASQIAPGSSAIWCNKWYTASKVARGKVRCKVFGFNLSIFPVVFKNKTPKPVFLGCNQVCSRRGRSLRLRLK